MQEVHPFNVPVGDEDPEGHGAERTVITSVAVDDLAGVPRSVALIVSVIDAASA